MIGESGRRGRGSGTHEFERAHLRTRRLGVLPLLAQLSAQARRRLLHLEAHARQQLLHLAVLLRLPLRALLLHQLDELRVRERGGASSRQSQQRQPISASVFHVHVYQIFQQHHTMH